VAGCCEHGNEPSGSIKYGEFLDQLSVLVASQGLCSMELFSCNEHKFICLSVASRKDSLQVHVPEDLNPIRSCHIYIHSRLFFFCYSRPISRAVCIYILLLKHYK
jgi:hypothetical protein